MSGLSQLYLAVQCLGVRAANPEQYLRADIAKDRTQHLRLQLGGKLIAARDPDPKLANARKRLGG